MIVKSYCKPFTYYYFTDNNMEIEFEKRPQRSVRVKKDHKFTSDQLRHVKQFFK